MAVFIRTFLFCNDLCCGLSHAVEGEPACTLFKPYPLSRAECPPAFDAQQLLVQHCQDAIAAMRDNLSAVSIQDMIDEMRGRYPEGLPGETGPQSPDED